MNDDLKEKSDPQYLKVIYYSNLIAHSILAILLVGLLVLSLVYDWTMIPFYVSLGVIVLSIVIFNFITPKLEYSRFSFEVDEDQIQIKSGIIWRKIKLIPMIRIQHVQYKSGPLLRKYNLATITVSTAGDVDRIPGLKDEYARQLKDIIGDYAKVEEPHE